MQNAGKRIRAITQRIREAEARYGRPAGSVALLAVSKKKMVGDILRVAAEGQRAFGENYLQEALPKITALAGHGLEWHFIGAIQSNKTREIASSFAWVHTVDRLKIARRLHEQRPAGMAPLNVCIEVNISGEASKAGIAPDGVTELAAAIAELANLRLRGLMALPAPATEFERQRDVFRELANVLRRCSGYGMDTLSIGTTDDFEAAIAEGATIVRIGTAIFGPRG